MQVASGRGFVTITMRYQKVKKMLRTTISSYITSFFLNLVEFSYLTNQKKL